MPKRAVHIVAYDIACDRRRARVLAAAKAFGMGGQKSVHECVLSESERAELRARLVGLIDQAADRILLVRLDPRGETRRLGIALPPPDPAFVYVD